MVSLAKTVCHRVLWGDMVWGMGWWAGGVWAGGVGAGGVRAGGVYGELQCGVVFGGARYERAI